jgi:hypothetical protein
VLTKWFSTVCYPVAYRGRGFGSFCEYPLSCELYLSSNHKFRACSLLNAVANGRNFIELSVPQTITAGDTIPVSWNRGGIEGDFTLGLFQASTSGLDNPLETTVVKASEGNSSTANIPSGSASGCVPSAVWRWCSISDLTYSICRQMDVRVVLVNEIGLVNLSGAQGLMKSNKFEIAAPPV